MLPQRKPSQILRESLRSRRNQWNHHRQSNAHNLVHEPYAAWCPLCGTHRGKDAHSNRGERSQRSDHSVISWDIGYCSRRDDEGDKLCVLFVRDSFTGLLGAIPTVQKGGRYLSSMTTESVRFIVQTGHASVGLRCDAEPSTLTLLQAVSKTCQGLNIKTHKEPTLLETIKLMVVQRSRCVC